VKAAPPAALIDLIRRQSGRPAAPAIAALAATLRARYGGAVQAILFYGSCLRSGDDRGGIVDLYAIVDRYRNAYASRAWAFFNALLPPNVFYLEVPFEGRTLRAKVAVLSLAGLERAASPAWFHSYVWARFTQPTALLDAASPEAAARVHAALGTAAMTFLARVVPCLPPRFSSEELWTEGFRLSYRAELRAERPEKLAALYRTFAEHYGKLLELAAPALPFAVSPLGGDPPVYSARIPGGRRLACRFAWRLRAVQGKILSVLRLVKGAFSFAGGLDYILWKIERHSGVRVEVPARLRRHPILAVAVVCWRLYRRGAFR
jgi:hypothetical protein